MNNEDREILEDAQYWQELEFWLPWKLIGFTHRLRATFVDADNQILVLSGRQRDDIVSMWGGNCC